MPATPSTLAPPPAADRRAAYAAERADTVERRIAGTRLAVLAFGTVLYGFVMRHDGTSPWLAYTTLAIAWIYAPYAAFFRSDHPSRHPLAGHASSAIDATLLMLWIVATGGVHSEFHIAMYGSVVAIAFQRGYRDAMVATALYAIAYLCVLALLGQLGTHLATALIRAGFVILIGPVGGLLAREALEQGGARLGMEDLKDAANAARENAEGSLSVLRATLESTADGIIVVDVSGRVVQYNRRFVELWRIPEAVLVSPESRRLAHVVDQMEDPDSFRRRVREIYSYPESESFDVLQLRDGRTFERYSRPQKLNGRIIGRVWSFRDVTERTQAEQALQESERRYRTLFEESKDALFIVGAGGELVDANPAAIELFGYESKAEFLKARPGDFLVDDSQQSQAHEAVVRDGALRDFELRARRTDGRVLDLLVTATAIVDMAGNLVGLRGLTRDVTLQKRLEAELRQAQKLEAVGRLAAGVAHEVNNPLTYTLLHFYALPQQIRALTERADPELLDTVLRRISDAREGTERVARIIGSLKTFSQLQQSDESLVDVRDVLSNALELSSNTLRHRARVVAQLEEVPSLRASAERLSQVFMNLLLNAAQAIPEGHVDAHEIRLRTRLEAGEVIVDVIDDGEGIAPANIEKIFDPFFTTRGVGERSGLGLSVCQNIVRSFGGRIDVESEPGRGSRFTVRLPVERSQEIVPREALTTRAGGDGPEGGRILVVDDEPLVRRAIAVNLGTEFAVVEAGSGRDALAILETDSAFDLILCDLMMPEITGMELYETLQRIAPTLSRRMIFMTGGAFTPRAETFLGRVPNRWIEKPFTATGLRELARQTIASGAAA